MDNSCSFRLEIPYNETPELLMVCSLWFADYSNSDQQNGIPLPQLSAFNNVSTKTYELHPCLYTNGSLCAYVPIVFETDFVCCVETMLHLSLIEFKFRLPKRLSGFSIDPSTDAMVEQQVHAHKMLNQQQQQLHSTNQNHQSVSFLNPTRPLLANQTKTALLNSKPQHAESLTPTRNRDTSIAQYQPKGLASPTKMNKSASMSHMHQTSSSAFLNNYLLQTLSRPVSSLLVGQAKPHLHLLERVTKTVPHALSTQGLISASFKPSSPKKSAPSVEGVAAAKAIQNDSPAQVPLSAQSFSPLTLCLFPRLEGALVSGTESDPYSLNERIEICESHHAHSSYALMKAYNSLAIVAERYVRSIPAESINEQTQFLMTINKLELPSDAVDSEVKASLLPASRSSSTFSFAEMDRAKHAFCRLKPLRQRIKASDDSLTYNGLTRLILRDLTLISQQIFYTWNQILQLLTHFNDDILSLTRSDYMQHLNEDIGQNVFREALQYSQRFSVVGSDTLELHNRIARAARNSAKQLLDQHNHSLLIRDLNLVVSEQAILFEQNYAAKSEDKSQSVWRNLNVDEQIIDDYQQNQTRSASSSFCENCKFHKHTQRPADLSALCTSLLSPSSISHSLADVSSHHENLPPNTISTDIHSRTESRRNSDSLDSPSINIDPRTSPSQFISERIRSSSSISDSCHLCVTVHGYNGNCFDMRLIKNQLELMHFLQQQPDPNAQSAFVVLMSSSNHAFTEGDISVMGRNLAYEIHHYVIENNLSLSRISFIAHSLGGLIVRACLTEPLFEPYLKHCFTYMSLATPHCGYIMGDPVLSRGIWLLKKWNKSTCLSQLSLTDDEENSNSNSNSISNPHFSTTQQRNYKCSYLYKLSQSPGLRYFQNIILCASTQDKYVPFASARIQALPFSNDSNQSVHLTNVYHSMVNSLLSECSLVNLIRLDFNFMLSENSFIDGLIGRAAHIAFLEKQFAIQALITIYKHYFR